MLLVLLAIAPLACGSSASAGPAPPPPPPTTPGPAAPAPAAPAAPAACKPAGAVVFEIDHRADPGAKLATSETKIFGNGAWTRDERDGDGTASAPRAGCLTKQDVAQLEATLSGAPWKLTTSEVRCMAVSSAFTVYQVRGKAVFTQRLCSGSKLDDKSRAKLDAAIALVERAAKP